MELPKNRFKEAILQGKKQIGLWSSIRDPAVSEMLAGCGYDWIVLDCEHSPRDVQEVLHGLHAMSAYPVEPVVRVKSLDVAEIKKMLDIGAQTILVPFVQNAYDAQLAVAAVTYPPAGLRGVAGGTRANRYSAIPDYFNLARDEICLIVQIETQQAMDNLEEIVSTEGVDAVFVGPADLAASLGHPGNPKHPKVQEAIGETIRKVRNLGKPAGFLSPDAELLELVLNAGSVFTAIDIDLNALRRIAMVRLSEYESFK